jgi:ADP-heptose:LPS heptosyltransferase
LEIRPSQKQEFRRTLYQWRQRKPGQRLFALILLLVVWPVRFIVHRLSDLVSRPEIKERILVIQFAGLGDTLMLTPALAALKDRYPTARIDFLTLHGYVAEAFRNHPLIDEIIVLPAYAGQWIVSRFANVSGARLVFATVRCYAGLILKLGWRRYGLGINFGLGDFDRSVGNALMFCLEAPARIGLPGPGEQLLSDRAEVDYLQTERVQSYLDFLKPLGVSAAAGAYQFPIDNHDRKTIDLLINDSKIDQSRPIAVVHPGGKLHINSRRWPAEYFARVCSFLSNEGFEIVLTGDQEDASVCDEIARSSGRPLTAIAGRLSFAQTAALLSRSELVITNDTSTLHLAEAVRVPRVVSIFGPTDSSLLAPRNERHTVFRSNLPCAPCMGGIIDGNTERCWREVKEECLWQTKPEQVIRALSTLYSKPAVRVARA